MSHRRSGNTTRHPTSARKPGVSSDGGKNTSANNADMQSALENSSPISITKRNLVIVRIGFAAVLWIAAWSLTIFLSDLSFLIFLISWVQMGTHIEMIKKALDQPGADSNHPRSMSVDSATAHQEKP